MSACEMSTMRRVGTEVKVAEQKSNFQLAADQLSANLSNLRCDINRLIEAMSIVLRNEPPSASNTNSDKRDAPEAPIMEWLNNQTDQVETCKRLIQDAHSRLVL